MIEAFEEQLRALRADVAKLLERIDGPPRVLRYERAAKLLDISPRKLADLVAGGVIHAVRIGGRKKIPLSEIERLATPQKAPPSRPLPGRKKHNGAKEADRALSLVNLRRSRR